MATEVFYRAMGLQGYGIVDVWEPRGCEIEVLVEPPVNRCDIRSNSFRPRIAKFALHLLPTSAEMVAKVRELLRLQGGGSEPASYVFAVDHAGFSIYIYYLTIEETNRVRRGMGLPELTGGK